MGVDGVLSRIGETPMVRVNNIIPGIHRDRLWAKLEGTNPGGSVKDRMALAMVENAEKEGLLQRGDTIVEATSGNTGIGLAMVCAVKGYKLVLTMPEDMSSERRNMFHWYGVEVRLTPAIEGMSGAVWLAGQLEKEGLVWLRQFENKANPQVHYQTTGPEIWQQSGGRVDVLVAGVGTGGTITGCGRYLKEKNPALKITAVEPASSPVLSGGRPGRHSIHGLGAGFVPGILDSNLPDQVITVSDSDAYYYARTLSQSEGISAGPSSGAALAAALQMLERHAGFVVAIFPDQIDRYLSTLKVGDQSEV